VIINDEQWTAKKCFDKFCPGSSTEQRLEKAKEKFSQGLYTALKNGNMDYRVVIWRAVFKKDDPIWEDLKPPKGGKKWYDVYFEHTGIKSKEDEPLLKAGYFSKPYVHWDFNKRSWETASRTPAFEAIYDNASLQQVFKNYMDSVQLRVRPSMIALAALKGKYKFNPEGVTYLNENQWNYKPEPIQQVGDVRFDAELIKEFKDGIGRHFSLDTFRMFTNLAENTNQDFRVLQLMEMAGERITQLLPTIESHENHLSEVDKRYRDLERQAGNGPFNRMELENVEDILVSVLGAQARNVRFGPEFIGTLRQTQQMQQKLKPISVGVRAVSELATAMGDPNLVRFMIKGFDVGDEALRAVNFPQKLIRELEDYQKLVAASEQSQAQREQFAQAIELMKASKNISGPVDPNSIAGMLAGAA
jgi:hypothetical protein